MERPGDSIRQGGKTQKKGCAAKKREPAGTLPFLCPGEGTEQSPHDLPPYLAPYRMGSTLCSRSYDFSRPGSGGLLRFFHGNLRSFTDKGCLSFLLQLFIRGLTVDHRRVYCPERRGPDDLAPFFRCQRGHPAVRWVDECPFNRHRAALCIQH